MPDYQISHDRSRSFYPVFERKSELQHQTHYCPGCGHGIAHKLLAKAIDEFKKLIKLDPYEPDGYQQLGIAYAAQGDLRRAAHSLEHALDLLPGDGSTFQELARVYARMGEKSESEKMFALYKKYVAFDLQKRNLQTQSRARSKDPAAQFALGEFLENSGNFSDALQYYRLASSLHPGDSAIKAKVEQISRQLGLAAE